MIGACLSGDEMPRKRTQAERTQEAEVIEPKAAEKVAARILTEQDLPDYIPPPKLPPDMLKTETEEQYIARKNASKAKEWHTRQALMKKRDLKPVFDEEGNFLFAKPKDAR